MKNFLRKLTGFSSKSLEKGFSLAEVMVSVAILGVVIMATVSQLRLSSKSATDMAADAEINNVTNKIISAIGTTEVCRKNFGGQPQDASYTFIKDNNDVILIEKDKTIGTSNGEIKVLSIETKKINDNEMTLVLAFQKKRFGMGDFLLGGPRREIPINTILASAPSILIEDCFANYDLVVRTAVQQSCKGPASHYNATKNPPYGTCEHIVKAPTPGPECGVGEFLKSVTNPGGVTEFVCGKLTEGCPAGQAITGFDSTTGAVTCEYIFRACKAGEFIVKIGGKHECKKIDCTGELLLSAFRGFDATGTPQCTPITTNASCNNGQFTQIDGAGNVVCSTAPFVGGNCGLGRYISGINPDGSIKCTRWIQVPFDCPAGQAISGIKLDGTPDCYTKDSRLKCGGTRTYRDCTTAGGEVITGAQSHCRFNQTSCPATWTKCGVNGFKTLYGVACRDTSNTWYCNQWMQNRAITPLYGNGGYGDQPIPSPASITCHHWVGTPGTQGRCDDTIITGPLSVSQGNVGCY